MNDPNKNKYDFLIYLLEKGDATICLDARHPKVDVPKNHKSNPSLHLVFNLNFKRPIDITEECICATLAFQGHPYRCRIPFEAVWAIFGPPFKEATVWEENIPKDVNFTNQLTQNTKKKNQIRSVMRNSSDDAPTKVSDKRDRSHLRIIK